MIDKISLLWVRDDPDCIWKIAFFKYNRQFWPTLANMHTLDYPYGQFKAVVKQLEYYIQLYYAHI